MALTEHVIAVITTDAGRAALVERSFERIAAAVRVVHIADAPGAEQLAAAGAPERRTPHLIVLDDWPSSRARETLQRIRASEALADARVIVLCNGNGERDIADAYALGASSCLTVPIDPDEFVTMMQEVGRYWLLLNRWPSW